ncbi:ribosomal protein S18 [Hesseltinella vesiculosa]|uniref:Small ribosomal subunit protein bS18m n=1 Tax=Hesseltinella vesiculosa TaxID=101127 RepID=A0A1X2GYN8_9FUNG|nr:ribosomal protein S18 [Hesseltinella vesiculosa]
MLRAFAKQSVCSRLALQQSSQRTFVTSQLVQNEQPSGQKNIQQATLAILSSTVAKDKAKPTQEGGQRYQKYHRAGDIYHPEDLNDARYQSQLRRQRNTLNKPTQDPFNVLGLNPLHEYKNYRLLSNFVSDIGKILPREKTGLTAKNQRKLAKAIKRARAMGLMSTTSKDPHRFSTRF